MARGVLSQGEAVRWTEAAFYRRDGDALRCTLCPHACVLADGQVGVCRVRRRHGDHLETATYATSVVHLDPVERKPLYHFRPGTSTVTLAAPGCSFRCNYCVNYRISQFGRPGGSDWTAKEVDPEAVVRLAASHGACVALSYSEPSLAAELTLALAEAGRPLGVGIVWKTNGFLSDDALAALTPVLDAVNVDVKAADDRRHQRLTGAPLGPVVQALRHLAANGVWVEVSTPLIPGMSASQADLGRIAEIVAGVGQGIPWHLLRFTPAFRMHQQNPTSPAELQAGVRAGRLAGLRHVYVERALGAAGRATRCPACHDTVVERGIWSLEVNRLRRGACPSCGTEVEGRW